MSRIDIKLTSHGGIWGAVLTDTLTSRRVASFYGWETKQGAKNTAEDMAAKLEVELTRRDGADE